MTKRTVPSDVALV